MENYKILRKIGSGNFAKVFLAVHAKTGEQVSYKNTLTSRLCKYYPFIPLLLPFSSPLKNKKNQVALKLIDKREYRSTKTRRRINCEIANMKLVQGHQNIISVLESKNQSKILYFDGLWEWKYFHVLLSLLFSLAFETQKHFVIVMEYVSGGELFDYIQKKDGMNETRAKEMFISIVQGVQHCHERGIAHRDLKLENILLDKDHQPKVTLFHLYCIYMTMPTQTLARVFILGCWQDKLYTFPNSR